MEKTHSPMHEVTPSDVKEEAISSTDSYHGNNPSGDADNHDNWCDDEDIYNEADGALDLASDMDREWKRRHDQFHTIGYRDGLTAGKEASAQEGFNDGFKKSVLVGYKWGSVRGITSVLACLPNGLKEKLVGLQETREKLQNLHESVHSVSTREALSEFHAGIMAHGSEEHSECFDKIFHDSSLLGKHVREFESLKLGISAV